MSDEFESSQILFEELVCRYADLVYHVAFTFCGNEKEAEDLTQEAFIKAWKGFHQFKKGTHFKTWVLKILHHTFIDRMRSKGRKISLFFTDLAPEIEYTDTPPIPPSIDIEKKEIFYDLFSEEITALIKTLPLKSQLILLLCDVEGMTYQEIADILSIPVGTVRSQIHRSRSTMLSLLKTHAKNIGYGKESKV